MNDDEYMGGARIPSDRRDAAQSSVQLIHNIMVMGCNQMVEPGAVVAYLAGVAMVPLGAIAASIAEKREDTNDRFGGGVFAPTIDEITFAAFYTISALEPHPNGMIAAFSMEAIDKALRMFKAHRGREYTNLAPILKEYIAKERNGGKNVPDGLRQFLPE